MREIKLTQGQVALVDDEDYDFLSQWKWYADKIRKTFYAKRNSPLINGKRCGIKMHHEIIGKPPKNLETDHKDGNGLNNRRNNLRHVTHRQNQQNQKNRKQSSRYPGVSWAKHRQKWSSKITINGIKKHLGLFINEFEAFEAYERAVNAIGENLRYPE